MLHTKKPLWIVALIAAITSLIVVIAMIFLFSITTHSPMKGHSHSTHSSGHDEKSMPGLFGENASPEESDEMRVLFRNFETLSREVENLPDGIRTITRSADPAVMDTLVSHVIGMIDRVDTGDDPQVIIQSPTLDIIFQRGDSIETSIDVTDDGIVVIQTSTNPEVASALQIHAAEVSDMAQRGMRAIHAMMDARAAN